jgi:VWFA-related protein
MEERMTVNRACAFLKSALIVVLAGGFFALVSSPCAQQGAGQNPVPATSEHEAAPSTNAPETETRIRVPSNMVVAPVTVISSKGDYVFDLQQKDFEVLDNGVRQKIEQFSLEQRPLAAVIMVETNGTSEPLLDEVRPLGPVFSNLMLGPQGEAAVVTYGDQIRDCQGFTQNSDELESALRRLEARGGSQHLNDALAHAIALLESQPKEDRRIIVAFSDGHDLGSKTTKEEVVQRALDGGITIYGLGFSQSHGLLTKEPKAPPPDPLAVNMALPAPPNMAPTPSNVSNNWPGSSQNVPDLPIVPLVLASGELVRSVLAKTPLEFYAGYTGGLSYGAWSKKPMQDELQKIADEIQSQYEIAYVPHAPSANGFHRIEVHVDRNGVKVRTKAGYFLGATSSNP